MKFDMALFNQWQLQIERDCMRQYDTGATRDTDEGKNDYEGFLSPLVIREFGNYMTKHRVQADGELRNSDNWQRGMPKDDYIKCGWRHWLDFWLFHRGHVGRETIKEALCAIMFNVMGYLHEILKEEEQQAREGVE
jgi:hypothetical protein